MTDNHTPLSVVPQDDAVAQPVPSPTTTAIPPVPVVADQSHAKEAEPARKPVPESSQPPPEAHAEDVKQQESGHEEQRSEKTRVVRVDAPAQIPADAAKAGLAVAPSARAFPTIYDVKVPMYSDEQIDQNLHKSFWTSARWLAELCKYMLWQAHIRIRRVGAKIIREPAR